jgi:hypothetical protein
VEGIALLRDIGMFGLGFSTALIALVVLAIAKQGKERIGPQ